MEIWLVIAGAIALVAVRRFAARRLIAGRGEFVWLWLLPQFVIVAVIAVTALQLLEHAPVAGGAIALATVVYGILVARLAVSLGRAISDGPSGRDAVFERTFDPLAEFALGTTALLLLAAFVGGIALVVSEVLDQRV